MRISLNFFSFLFLTDIPLRQVLESTGGDCIPALKLRNFLFQ